MYLGDVSRYLALSYDNALPYVLAARKYYEQVRVSVHRVVGCIPVRVYSPVRGVVRV